MYQHTVSETGVVKKNSRHKDEPNHENSTGLLLVGDVASTDTEKTRNDVWWDLEQF
jgi:hypothetical protein